MQMQNRPDIDKKVQEVLASLVGIQRAEPRPFFYTRLIGRLQQDKRTIWESIGSFLARPVVAVASLCIVLVLNGFILFRQDGESNFSSQVPTSNELVTATENEYILASSSSFDYENLDQ